jgi:hypothetical protein
MPAVKARDVYRSILNGAPQNSAGCRSGAACRTGFATDADAMIQRICPVVSEEGPGVIFRSPSRRKMVVSNTPTNEHLIDVMTGLKKRFRRGGTAVLVAIYALGILGPAVAFARADAASVIHVLSESHGGFLTLHFHNDGRDHGQSKKPGSGHAHQCCGVTSISGLEPGDPVSLVPLTLASAVVWPGQKQFSGRNRDRVDRPPRFSLPL